MENTEPGSEYTRISVTNPLIKDNIFSKHVLYGVSGHNSKGLFQVSRRYKEFSALRIALVHRWPGCYIPMIPPKKAIVTFT